MNADFSRILLTEAEIAGKVREIAGRIDRDYENRQPLMVGILKGSFIFMADLVRAMKTPCAVDFMAVSSYGKGSVSTGAVRILKDLDTSIEGKDVILVEDILDSGLTLSYIIDLMARSKPSSVRICTLLDKPERRKVPISADYPGFGIPDEFVVGYGLDYAEKYRNLPYIAVLSPHIYNS